MKKYSKTIKRNRGGIVSPNNLKNKIIENKTVKIIASIFLAIIVVFAGLMSAKAATTQEIKNFKSIGGQGLYSFINVGSIKSPTEYNITFKGRVYPSVSSLYNEVNLDINGKRCKTGSYFKTAGPERHITTTDVTITFPRKETAYTVPVKLTQTYGSYAGTVLYDMQSMPIPALDKFNQTFDGNGATSGEVETLRVSYGHAWTYPENSYKREGYRFIGWNEKADGTGTMHQPGDTGRGPNANNRYYATWKKVSDITYHINFRDEYTERKAPITSDLLGEDAFKVNNYHITGWNTSSNGTGTSYNLGEVSPFKETDSALDLYAIWEETYVDISLKTDDSGEILEFPSIKYHPDMISEEDFNEWILGRFYGSNKDDIYISHNDSAIIGWIPEGKPDPISNDQVIGNWLSFAEVFSDIAEDTNAAPEGGIVLIPQFNPKTVTVNFDANGGEFESGANSNTIQFDLDVNSNTGSGTIEYKLSSGEYEEPFRDGYKFEGFITYNPAAGLKADEDVFTYPVDEICYPEDTFELIAAWSEDSEAGAKDVQTEDGMYILTNSKPVPVEIQKIDEYGSPVQGSIFDLYKMKRSYSTKLQTIKTNLDNQGTSWLSKRGDIKKTVMSDSKGEVDFGDLDFGSYVIVERVVPEQYKKNNEYGNVWYLDVNDPSDSPDSQFFLASLDSSYEIKTNQTGNLRLINSSVPDITIEKKDNATKEPLAGGKFELVRIFDNKSFGTSSANENGQISFSNVPKGVYMLTELESPSSIDGNKSYGSGTSWRIEVKEDRTLDISEL